MLINEWQLNTELNRALQLHQHADFQLWLSFLSPATEEQASFCFPDQAATPKPDNLQHQLQLAVKRDPALRGEDIDIMCRHNHLMQHGGFAAMRLGLLLQPPPAVIQHDAKKLSADLMENLSLHCKRHLSKQPVPDQPADATLLYDVLEQLHAAPAAA